MKIFLAILGGIIFVGCSSSSSQRSPASRAGRPYAEPKTMNRHSMDTESLFQACLREWPELYCRNRMGR
ncbi:MAG: hypothetical protein K2Q26_15080 [Bdellovibrionales bacterium]|nr:hypothetical protein [Bdellovibrionales bacterium]